MNFLKSINYPFLLQLLILFLLFKLVSYFYKRLLNTNKKFIEIKSERFPSLSKLIEKDFNNRGVLYGALVILIAIPAFIGGGIFVYAVGAGTLYELEKIISNKSWLEQISIWACVILFYCFVKFLWDDKNKKKSQQGIS